MTRSANLSSPAADPADATKAANWLALAATALPFLQFFPLDFDRTAPLLVLPALWFGRRQLVNGLSRLARGPRWLAAAGAIAALALVISLLVSVQPAPAIVATGAWILLVAAGILGGELGGENPGLSFRVLAGIAIGGAAGTLATWFLWWNTGRGPMPLYADPRHLGLHLISGVIAATALVTSESATRRQRLTWLTIGIVTWGGLWWSGGRTAVGGVAMGLILWLIRAPANQRRQLAIFSPTMAVAGLALSAIFWSPRIELGWWHMISRTTTTLETGDASTMTSTRTDFWRETVQRAKTAPWFGHGPDSYRFLAPKLDGQQPHNVVLQLWLDLGAVGATPLLLMLAGALLRGMRRDTPALLPWWSLLAASVAAGMLDGVFYHVLALLPALLAAGSLLMPDQTAPPMAVRPIARTTTAFVALSATAVLFFHAWLFQRVAVSPPPASPAAFPARLLRHFPSTSFGLWRWLDHWQDNDPAASLAWARWAQTHSTYSPLFHLYAARCLLQQNDRNGANREMNLAWLEANRMARPGIEAVQKQNGFAAGPGIASP